MTVTRRYVFSLLGPVIALSGAFSAFSVAHAEAVPLPPTLAFEVLEPSTLLISVVNPPTDMESGKTGFFIENLTLGYTTQTWIKSVSWQVPLGAKGETQEFRAKVRDASGVESLFSRPFAFTVPEGDEAPLRDIRDGDLIRASGDFKVYIVKIVGPKRFIRWFVGPQLFGFYRHLGFSKVKVVTPATLENFNISLLIRAAGDTKVYVLENGVPGVGATKRWVETLADFETAGYSWDEVYVVNSQERDWYTAAQ